MPVLRHTHQSRIMFHDTKRPKRSFESGRVARLVAMKCNVMYVMIPRNQAYGVAHRQPDEAQWSRQQATTARGPIRPGAQSCASRLSCRGSSAAIADTVWRDHSFTSLVWAHAKRTVHGEVRSPCTVRCARHAEKQGELGLCQTSRRARARNPGVRTRKKGYASPQAQLTMVDARWLLTPHLLWSHFHPSAACLRLSSVELCARFVFELGMLCSRSHSISQHHRAPTVRPWVMTRHTCYSM